METIGSIAAEVATLQNSSNLRWEIAKAESEIRSDVAKAEADIRKDIAKSECDVKHMISEQTNHLNLRFADMHNNIRDGKEEAIKAGYEARIESGRLAKEQLIETLKGNDLIKSSLGDAIVALSKQVADCCCESEKSGLRDRIASTRDELSETRLSTVGNQIVTAVVNALRVTVPPTQATPPIVVG